MLMKKVKLFFTVLALTISALAFGQNITVKGVVTDASNGEPVPFASIQLQGTMTGASTDGDGIYTISVPSNGTLVFSSVGYTTQSVAVEGRAQINVQLAPDAEFLDETIVVAYGTATKSSFTGSASMVKSDEIEKKITSTVTSALAGTTPGVQVISSSGDPTSGGPSITIRGIGSLSANNSPLIVVDGAPYSGSIKDINPNDVESMSVLKDASASAIYGHRGANGVILITTKRGQSGDATVKFDAKFGSNSRLIPQYDVITDPGEYYENYYKLLYNKYYYAGSTPTEAYALADKNLYDNLNGGLGYKVFTVPEGQKLVGTNFKLNPNAKLGYTDGEYYYTPDNWYDEVFHNSFRQEYNLSVSGAADKFTYYASLGYLDDGGIVSNSGYNRYTARINTEYQVKKWAKFVTNVSFSHSNSQTNGYSGSWGSSGNLFYLANNIGPIYPLYVRDAQGNIMTENGRTVYDSNNTNFTRPNFVGNAVRDNEVNDYHYIADVLVGKFGLILTPFKGFTLEANANIYDDNTRKNALYSMFGSASPTDGSVSVEADRYFTLNQQYLAKYKTDFGGSQSNLDVLAGYEQYNSTSSNVWGSNDHLFNPVVGELDNADGSKSKTLGSNTTHYMTEGFLARAQYDFAGKYFASASFRRDASSRFAKGHRWGNFWSLGAAWLISQEDFMSNVSWVDMLKLKASFGQQGNDNLGSNFPYSDQYKHSYNEETGEYSISLSYKGNNEITWETHNDLNVGVDFELFRGALNGTVEYFNNITTDMLYNKSVPLSSGNPTGRIPVNVGDLQNTGVEITLDGLILNRKNFQWSWNANFSHYTNKILSLDESVAESGIKGSNYIWKIGGSRYDAYTYKYAGVDPTDGRAKYWKHVVADDGTESDEITYKFDEATQYELGSVLPKLFGGFGTTLNAFGFDFSAQFSYQLGGKYYDGNYQQLMWTQASAGQAWHKDALKAWTPENTDTDVPRLDGDTTVSQSSLDRFFVSSNYLSVNNVTLGYTFPAKWVKKAALSALRVYVAGENLAVLTARKGMDPRNSMGLGSFTMDQGSSSYSSMRTITGGITLTF